MEKLQITLTLTHQEALQVLAFVETLSEAHSSPTSPKLTSEDKVSIKTIKAPTGLPSIPTVPIVPGKITKMPSFGRSQEQIDTYVEERLSRKEELDEEAVLKQERLEEQKIRKAEKAAEHLEKRLEDEKRKAEVAAILKQTQEKPVATTPKKPWEL